MTAFTLRGGKGWEQFLRAYRVSPTLHVGILENSAHAETGENPALYAASREFGSELSPPRPFMRPAIQEQGYGWTQYLAASLRTGMPVPQAMELLGARMTADMQEALRNSPPAGPADSRKTENQSAGNRNGKTRKTETRTADSRKRRGVEGDSRKRKGVEAGGEEPVELLINAMDFRVIS